MWPARPALQIASVKMVLCNPHAGGEHYEATNPFGRNNNDGDTIVRWVTLF